MAITVKHNKVSTIPDTDDTSLVRPSDWNADHTLVGTIDVANGGTGASTLTGYVKGNGTSAMTAVATVPSTDITGLGTMSTQNANAVAITGGTINGTTIGATTPSSVNATTITGQTGVLRGTGTNLITQSQNLLNATWTNNATTVSATLYTDPLGGTTANNLIETATTNSHFITGTVSVTSGINYTFSAYLKIGVGATAPNFVQLSLSTGGFASGYGNFNISTGALGATSGLVSSSITSVGSGWYRCSITATATATGSGGIAIIGFTNNNNALGRLPSYAGAITSDVLVWGTQFEVGSTLNNYVATTTTAVYGTPTLSFSGVSTIGLESNGSLFVQPAGTGALQAQATTSTTAGGNARGANAVDLQTSRVAASQVASGLYATIGGGIGNTSNGTVTTVAGGNSNIVGGTYAGALSGISNIVSGFGAAVVTGYTNTAAGHLNFIGGGFSNSGTSASAVTTQSGTMNGTTAVTLSGSNANIKVGQFISGTSIATFPSTYVAAISGTSLTLSQAASGSSTSTLSFFTPHGVVVGGGNNQATGSYSFIGGGGDAGASGSRNAATGDWSVVVGGKNNTASGISSFIGGGGFDGLSNAPNTASGTNSVVGGGQANSATAQGAFVGSGASNFANANFSAIMGGVAGSARSIIGNHVFPACLTPISGGNTQAALLILARQTTDATPTVLASTTSAAGTTNQVILPNNSAYFFRGEVISGVTGGGNTKGWTIEGVIKRGANAASTALVGTPTVTSTYADAGASTWTIAVTADTTNGGLRVTFTGQASTTIRTVCQIRTTEMTY
jgi:hypothetical protein